jgi:hypothetical protein
MIKRFCDKCGREIKLYLRIITISEIIDDRKFEKPETEKVLELCKECSEKILKLKKRGVAICPLPSQNPLRAIM